MRRASCPLPLTLHHCFGCSTEFTEGCAKYVVARHFKIITPPAPSASVRRTSRIDSSKSSVYSPSSPPAHVNKLSFGAIMDDEVGGSLSSPLLHDMRQNNAQEAEEGDSGSSINKPTTEDGDDGDDGDEDDDDEEMPEDIAALDPKLQQVAIIKRSVYWLLSGTALVLVFSDPFVDILVAVGGKTGIPTFYVSFVLAPFVTNGSELFASYTFAKKKTSSSMSCSFQQLFGAAIMNNTYCLLIFFALIYFQDLYWAFSAETLSILFVELVMLFVAAKSSHRVVDGLYVLSLYPICLLMVWVLENEVGFD